jgi:long-chain acyl-CoA synthetase
MLAYDFFQDAVHSHAHKIALISGGGRWSYFAIEQNVDILATILLREGIQQGDRVSLLLSNSAAAVVAILAVLKIGAVFVPLTPGTSEIAANRLLTDSEAVTLITDEAEYQRLVCTIASISSLGFVLILSSPADSINFTWERKNQKPICSSSDGRSLSMVSDSPPAALLYTSGSTGHEKGVLLTNANIVFSIRTIVAYLRNTEADVVLNLLPLSHTYGLTQLLTTFAAFGTLILQPWSSSPETVLSVVAREKVTGLPLVPPLIKTILQCRLTEYDLFSLRYITSAAAPLPVSSIRSFRTTFPQVQLFSMYGQTECMRASFLPPDQIDARPESVGRGLAQQEVAIIEERGVPAATGVTGELAVSGPNVMAGYWRKPEETAKVLKRSTYNNKVFLHTGDLFRRDEEGFLYFVSRKDDIINSCGEKVCPRQVEEVLCGLDGVLEAAVVGIPDDLQGNAVKAFVVLHPSLRLSRRDIFRHCSKHLDRFQVPTFVEFCNCLPKTSTGKVKKYKLVQSSVERRPMT